VLLFPFDVTMSQYLNVSMFPCLHRFASMFMSPCFQNSANGKRNEWKTATSYCFLQMENSKTANFRCCKRKQKTDICCFFLVDKRLTVIKDCFVSKRARLCQIASAYIPSSPPPQSSGRGCFGTKCSRYK
jgi:hypothetical protein